MGTLKRLSNGPLYSNTVIGTLAVDGWAVTFSTTRRDWACCGPAHPLPVVPNVTAHHQRPVYQLHIIGCGTIIASAL